MHRTKQALRGVHFTVLAMALLAFAVGCGGGSSSQGGDRHGEDTPTFISHIDDILGIQGTLYADPNGHVRLNYHVQDAQYDSTDVEVQIGWDVDGDDVIEDHEYIPATGTPASEGTQNLNGSPDGAAHSYTWDSVADIGTSRIVNQDYEYTPDGRRARDGFGDVIFRQKPGAMFRVSPILPNDERNWAYSNRFSISNNHAPQVTEFLRSDVTIPPEGIADGTVNEHVAMKHTVMDLDGDPVIIAVDWAAVSKDYDATTKTTEELAALNWKAATASTILGEGTFNLAAPAGGLQHDYGWHSVPVPDDAGNYNAGTDNTGVLMRIRPIDGKFEVGDWYYMDQVFHLDNFTIFTDVNVLPGAVTGARATLLTNGNVLVAGGENAAGTAVSSATHFYPTGGTQTTKGNLASVSGGFGTARKQHTLTRLFREEDPSDATVLLDAKVLACGGMDDQGNVLSSAVLYDPADGTGAFSATGSMTTPRYGHIAVLLRSGKVLVAGGTDDNGTVLSSAELFDPAAGTWTAISGSAMFGARTGARAVMLPGVGLKLDQDGYVLVVGGKGSGGAALATIEVYDATDDAFDNMDSGHNLDQARYAHTLTETVDATYPAVAAGGMASEPKTSIERYNQQLETWAVSDKTLREGHANHLAVLLGEGRILFAGGQNTEAGAIAATGDIYDPTRNVLDTPNGDMLVPVRNAPAVVLENGRVAIFGGTGSSGVVDAVQIFTPDSEATRGFNNPPTVEIRTPSKVEPWAFGVVIPFRGTDPEGDLTRVVFQYKVKESATDSTNDSSIWTQALRDKYLNRWLPMAMLGQTVLGDKSSGTSGLTTRTTQTNQVDNPIDNPDDPNSPSDAGEHLFIWYTGVSLDNAEALRLGGIPKGDYDNVYARVIISGATEGSVATTGSFAMTKNAPVIARFGTPMSTYGHIVFPYWLQDSDSVDANPISDRDVARLVWEYGIDTNGDGKIIEVDGESWVTASMTASSVGVTVGTTTYYNPVDFEDVETLQTGEVYGSIPWGKRHNAIWDSVKDLGAPANPRTDIIFRVVPYDYPSPPPQVPLSEQSLGIGAELSGFTLEKDPNGLYLTTWYPLSSGTTSVKTNEPLVFVFSQNVDLASVTTDTIRIVEQGGTALKEWFPRVSGGTVTIYPQVQEIPARTDILEENKSYSITIPGYDPANPGQAIIHRAATSSLDTNAYNLLAGAASSFATGAGTVDTSPGNPGAPTLVSPSPPTNVPVTTRTFQVRYDERLDPSTVTHENLEVFIGQFTGVSSVVPGSIEVQNVVTATEEYSLVTFTLQSPSFPYGQAVQIYSSTDLEDFGGNGLGSAATSSFTMEAAPPGSSTVELKEPFDNDTNRNYDLTTCWWGIYDPKNPGDFAGKGTAGNLTGIFEFGAGTTALTSGQTLYWNDTNKGVFEFSSINLPSGHTVTLRPAAGVTNTYPCVFRVKGSVTIAGTIDCRGSTGANGFRRTTNGNLAVGGAGGPGGYEGGSAGSWTTSQTTAPTGSSGKGTGGGKAGTSYRRTRTSASPYYFPGGGGAGHAAAGKQGGHGYGRGSGYYSLWGGAGGIAYGNKAFTDGAATEVGSGGGPGGSASTHSSSTRYRGCWSGGGGGGGGGLFRLFAMLGINLTSTGKILCSGGAGGRGYYYYYYTYAYSGGGGGGSGGGADLASPNLTLDGVIDVAGGAKGAGSYTYSAYHNNGGDGAGGRVRLGMSGTVWQVNAVVTKGTATITSAGNGTQDWTVTSNRTVNTTNGVGGVGWDSASKQFRVKDFTINAGVTLTLTGDNPFVVMAKGNVALNGDIVGAGGDARQRTSYDYTGSLRSYWYHYDEYRTRYTYYQDSRPADAGPGGGKGGTRGSKRTYTNFYGWYHRPSTYPVPEDGKGWNAAGTLGGGKKGTNTTPRPYRYGSSYNYYYYYSGPGGGGASAENGTVGVIYRSYSGYKGTPGAGSTDKVNLASMTPAEVRGGGGGGGGSYGGIRRYNDYRYPRGGGNAGGSGGAGIGISADGSMHLGGLIDVHGGMGGSQLYTFYYYNVFGGAGGGAAGGNVRLHAKDGFTFTGPKIDCGGGVGGITTYYSGPTSTPNTRGGTGAKGGLHFTAASAVTLPAVTLSSSGLNLGNGGTLHVQPFALTDTAVSVWRDTGTYVPEYRFGSPYTFWSGTGLKELWVEGAHTDPATDLPDENNTSGWKNALNATELAKIDGYRFVRFKAVIDVGAKVSDVEIEAWIYH